MSHSFPVAYSLDDVGRLGSGRAVVTLGVFDGVHRGHRAIIEELVEARNSGLGDRAIVMTFDPHPVAVTRSREVPPILSTLAERIELMSMFDVDGMFVVKFDNETAQMDYRDFIDRYFLEAMTMNHLVLGYDCHFGHRRQGSPLRVEQVGKLNGFGVTVVDPVEVDTGVVSSTEIRNTILGGNLERANRLMGHPYLVGGTVRHGEGRGRDLGFPTANISVSHKRKLWPPGGVYAVRVGWREWVFDGMMNVGSAPTVKGGKEEIEVHIFDFDNHIYGEEIFVYCEAFLREERVFPSLDALVGQLEADRGAARDVLATKPRKGD